MYACIRGQASGCDSAFANHHHYRAVFSSQERDYDFFPVVRARQDQTRPSAAIGAGVHQKHDCGQCPCRNSLVVAHNGVLDYDYDDHPDVESRTDKDGRPDHGRDGSQRESEIDGRGDLENVVAEKCGAGHSRVHRQNTTFANWDAPFPDVVAPFFPFYRAFSPSSPSSKA